MTKRNYNIKEYKRLGLLTIFLMLFGIGNLWADGSKDLYPSGAQGGRAYLRASTTESPAFPFPNLGTHYVYAEAGERIALASSAQSGSVKRIYLYNPSGQDVTPTISSGVGNIPNRSGELAGPRLPNQNAGGDRYAPIYYTVPAGGNGIYKVEFRGTSSSTTGDTRMNYVAANANWTQANNSNYLAAWDISVAKQTGGSWSWQSGRVYTTVLNMDNPSYNASQTSTFRPNSGFHGKFKVLTRDGYVYNVDNNGNQGISFTFMVNNRGFHVVGNPNTPSYQSIAANSAAAVQNRYHDPRLADGEAAVTQKIFYTLPDGNMPEYATGGPASNAETWLRIPQKSLNVDNLEVVGAEGSSQQLGSKGAYIKFTNESGGDYYITIRPKEGATQTFPVKELSGTSIIGDNEIYWDGKDGQGNPLPPGISEVEVDLKLRGAEVHFPYIDMELNHFGIILELLTEDLQGVVSDKVYWDDTGIGTGGGNNGTKTTPRNASHNEIPDGTSSNTNGHIWGLNSNATQNTFGDNMGMDTWTFIEGDVLTVDFDVDVKEADFYTKIDYSVNNTSNADSGEPGQYVTYEVTAGSYGPSDTKGAVFTFTVPVGVDIVDPENISFTTSCDNGTVVQAEALTYNEKSRTFTSKLDLPANCSITYTFNGTLSGVLGIKTAESTILRPNDVYDPDATNGDMDTPPTNPHYECFNNAGGGGSIGCNNIQEVVFMLLQDCTEEFLYYEDFGRTTWEVNSGRTDFVGQASISLDLTSGIPVYSGNVLQRNGQVGGATSTYLFAPGIGDNRYAAANVSPHSSTVSVARIKSGYYSVNPPGYVQMGIPETDSWHEGLWVPNAPSNDPTLPNSNYDWTPAWTHPDAIRDVSGAVNGAAFLVRGAASASQSIKPFYEFDVPGTIANGETYTLSMYSYVTYHDKDYMIMDVIDKNTGFIYASVPLKYPGPGLPPGASPEGFSLGWVPLQASVKFDSQDCEIDIAGKEVKIAIRGSQDRSLETGKGFGHTLIDDISFTKRTIGGSCTIPTMDITCEDACYEDVEGRFDDWHYRNNPGFNTVEKTFTQPGTDGGFVLDIYYLDNSFNMNINGIDLYEDELEFQKGVANSPQNVRFKSDGAIWEEGTIQDMYKFYQNETISEENKNSYTPVVRVVIDKFGNASLFGIREEYGVLEELEVFDSNGPRSLNTVHWLEDTSSPDANTIIVSQNVVGVTAMTVYGYGQNQKECEFCDIIKDGLFDDNNQDGFAQAGETITYTFDVINAGDMAIHDIEIVDPLFGFNIKLDESTHEPTLDGVTFEGDMNNNGVLDVNETWKFTVKYTVTNEDIFTNKGVHNRATVTGVGKIGNSEFTVEEDSVPTEDNKQIEGRDPDLPNHTYVPLQGNGLLITNPMIYQKVKKLN